MSVEGSLRERRRADTIREIKAAALRQLTEGGTGALSLRAVARSVGMSVQSLYHYFDSREALLTALLVDAHHALADAVTAAADESRGLPAVDRQLATSGAYRDWALANRSAFMLLFGTPVPDFAPPPEAGTGPAAFRLALPFLDTVFDGWTAEQLAALPVPPGMVLDGAEPKIPLPPGALALLLELRARMHGLVMLELIGHVAPFGDLAGPLYTAAMRRIAAELDALRGA